MLQPNTIKLCIEALEHKHYIARCSDEYISNETRALGAAIDDLKRALTALSAPAPEQVFTDDYYAGYAAGMQTEREHQEALSRLVMQRTPPAPEQGEIGESRLRPCPFCGDKYPTIIHFTIDREAVMHQIECSLCKAEISMYKEELDAIVAWNQRTPPAPAVPARGGGG